MYNIIIYYIGVQCHSQPGVHSGGGLHQRTEGTALRAGALKGGSAEGVWRGVA